MLEVMLMKTVAGYLKDEPGKKRAGTGKIGDNGWDRMVSDSWCWCQCG